MKVPQDALLGHAFHTYQLVSGDGSVTFEFQHNVVGRTTYAEGTVDACLFLAKQIEDKADKKLYNMIDVLGAGSMR
jgi:4-hydroxy-tetrahydrodipicolinate reductase